MASAQTLINRSLRLIGALAAGETPSSQETDDALTTLNAMLEGWRNDSLTVYALVNNSLTMVSGTSSYTIGTSGNLNITRPVTIESAYMTVSGIDSQVKLVDEALYDAIPDKTTTSSLVEKAFYNPTVSSSQGTLTVWPVPSAANVLHLVTWLVLDSISSLSATITLPPGYEDAISTNLAIRISPEYPGAKISPILLKMASDSLATIKRINKKLLHASSPMAQAMSSRRSNILIGP